ncbi:MAG TPA: DUF1697 domain-containing protein [Propionibacteriaceae bacterium]|nr:DUF1697 domain-containing protein [Propionibacteriaceae bacterium]
MIRYAALLRGIAPSGKNQSNAELRGVFDSLGFERVSSVLASGNIIFSSDNEDVPALERSIEEGLIRDLGLRSRTIVRSHAELRRLLDSDPFPGLTHGRGTYLTATFLKDAAQAPIDVPSAAGLTRIVGYDPDARAILAITDNSVPGQTPDFMAASERTLGRDITTRTWLTVQRIVAKLES